ncbi:MAG: extracellular solute-binding protein [Treponema sp.]|jgi:multiple sugar transport system substrate-binding protein|nr:extracellular solute-binding protein [Treponema sp.]
MKSKTTLVLCALLLARVVWAGGGKESAGGPVTLRFAWWGSQVRNDQTQKVIDLFEKANPGIKVEGEFTSFTDHFNNLSTQIAAGDIPDLIQHDYRYLATYVNRNLLAPLDPYLKKQINIDHVDQVNLQGGVVAGKLYGFNMGNNIFGAQYSVETFKKYGITPPSNSWTYDDFVNISRQFKAKGIYGVELSNFWNWVVHYLRCNGAHLYSQTGKGLGYNDDKLMERIFQMRLDLVKEGLMPGPDEALAYTGWEDNLFTRGQAAMITFNSNSVGFLATSMGSTVKSVPLFGPNSDKGTFIKPSMFLSISAVSQYKDQCAMMIDFFTNNVEANKIMMGERGVPISSAIRDALRPLMNESETGVFDLMDYAETHSSLIDNPDPEGAAEAQKLLEELEEEVLYGRVTPTEAATRFRREATAILTN